MLGKAQRLLFDFSHGQDHRYLRRITVSDRFRHWLYTDSYRQQLGDDPLVAMKRSLTAVKGIQRFAVTDLKYFLPEDVLFKVDRMSMANGLEVRVPLLDHHLLAWELSLPTSMRFRHGRGKYLLRKVAARYLPEKILEPRKQGFTVPVGDWLRTEAGNAVQKLFQSERFAQRGIIQQERALQLLAMHRNGKHQLGHRIWSLAVLEMWFREWMDV
jgi:asparagine synthase (glutamine-hydrolysing)